jgi:serine/threonine protein kinase
MTALHHNTGWLMPQAHLRKKRYLIIDRAGQGGMGAVYEAIDRNESPPRRVAIKEMSQARLSNPKDLAEAVRHFRREASILRALDHPNIPRVYAYFEDNDRQYLVMDYIEGITLQQILDGANQPLLLGDVLKYACQLCDVLAYLHRQYPPVMFRDLKPSNVMVTPDGHLYLIDFGIARFFTVPGDTEEEGTIGYAAPEQYYGNTTPRSDLYGLGATIFCCLTARDPKQNTPDLFTFDFSQIRVCCPQAPQALEQLLWRLLEKDPNQRPSGANAVRQELDRIMAGLQMAQVPQALSSSAAVPALPPLVLPGGSGGSSAASAASLTLPIGTGSGSAKAPGPSRRTSLLPMTAIAGMWAVCATFFLTLTRALFTARGLQQLGTRIRHLSPEDIKSGMIVAYETLDIWLRELLSNVLTPPFLFLLVVRLVLLIFATMYLFRLFHASYTMTAFWIALLFFCIAIYAAFNKKIREALARRLLLTIAFFALLVCFALQALPDVQAQWQTLPLAQVVSLLLFLLAAVTLVRTSDALVWVDHLGAIGIVCSCAFLLYGYGLPLLAGVPWLSAGPTTDPIIIEVWAIALAFFAFIFLLRLTRAFAGIERFFLLLAALLLAFLLWQMGYQVFPTMPFFSSVLSMLHLPVGSPDSLSAFRFYVVVALIPLAFAVISLFAGQNHPYLNRLSLVVLLLSCALLIGSLGQQAVLVIPLSSPNPLFVKPLAGNMQHLLTLNQLSILMLAMVGIALLARLRRPFSDLERILFGVAAIAGSSLLSAFWSGAIQRSQLPIMLASVSLPDQLSTIAANQLTAAGLLCLGVIALALFFGMLLMQSARHLLWVDQRVQQLSAGAVGNWARGIVKAVDRLIIFGIALIAALLLLFFGADIPYLQQPIPFQQMGVSISFSITYGFIPLCIMAVLALVALCRITRPVNAWDRFTLVVGISVFIVQAVATSSVLLVPAPLIEGVQQATARFFQFVAPGVLLLLSVIGAAMLALLWLKRTPARDRLLRVVLFVSFVGAIGCVLLHYARPALLPVALILLVQGLFIAVQMERVR